MILSDLLKDAGAHGLVINNIVGDTTVSVDSIVYDSRLVKAGSAFFCLVGARSDGHAYAADCIAKGASVFFASKKIDEGNATVVYVDDSRVALRIIADAFYGHPADKLKLIGITGTKGKTTTAHMIKGILETAGMKVGMIGTNGAYAGSKKQDTVNTTPESAELSRLFAWMADEGITHVVMEVSSQAYKTGRCDGLTFEIAAFLNITPDHIGENEHADFEEYFHCKSMLFDHAAHAIVNIDADRWQEMIKGVGDRYTSVSMNGEADLYADGFENTWEPGILGLKFNCHGLLEGEYKLSMPGDFNVGNALCAAAIALKLGADEKAIKDGLKNVQVKGRMQLMTCAAPITTLLIDYAHNAVSMEHLLLTLKEYNPGRLIVMFGGGGNRPKARRYEMGEMAGKYADFVLVTSDNSRYEDVNDIVNDILVGLNKYDTPYEIITDRKKAIHYLLEHCGKDDIVALAGKGHEEYQDIMGVKTHFSEQEIVEEYMKEYNAKENK